MISNAREYLPDDIDTSPSPANESESALLGCILLDCSVAMPVVIAEDIDIPSFGDLRNREVFRVMKAMYREGTAIDINTLKPRLSDSVAFSNGDLLEFLTGIESLAPSAHNASYYIPDIKEAHTRRLLWAAARKAAQMACDKSVKPETLRDEIDSSLRGLFHKENSMPEPVDVATFLARNIPRPPEVIKGVLHRGCKLVLGGASKTFKTWNFLDLALSVSHGLPWLGIETTQGRVLYVNFEIPEFSWQDRIRKVALARGLKTIEPGLIDLWNLRGKAKDYKQMIPKLEQKMRHGKYSLAILDPIYKLYGAQMDENKASDVAGLMNGVEEITQGTGAAVAFGAHFSKGNQSGKESIDRISGSGVFARDPDSILIFTSHKEPDAFTVEATLRNCPPLNPFVVRWTCPIFKQADDLDPADLKPAKGGKQPEHDPVELLKSIREHTAGNPISVSEWAKLAGIPRQTLQNYIPEIRSSGWIKTVGEGNTARQAITDKGLAQL